MRTTKDIDIVPAPNAENMSHLWEALAAVRARPAEFAAPLTGEGLIDGRGNWVC